MRGVGGIEAFGSEIGVADGEDMGWCRECSVPTGGMWGKSNAPS